MQEEGERCDKEQIGPSAMIRLQRADNNNCKKKQEAKLQLVETATEVRKEV